jgi:hypothetical protein
MSAEPGKVAAELAASPPGTYAGGARSPVVYVYLCPPCAGYAPITSPDYSGALSGACQGCGSGWRELHRFPAVIVSASGCQCRMQHDRVTGDMPDACELTGAVQRAWDQKFTPCANGGVDYQQARLAVETVLRLTVPTVLAISGALLGEDDPK